MTLDRVFAHSQWRLWYAEHYNFVDLRYRGNRSPDHIDEDPPTV